MTFYDEFVKHFNCFFSSYLSGFDCTGDMHDASKNDNGGSGVINYLVDTKYSYLQIVSMDKVAQGAYKKYKNAQTKHVPNSVDAFLIDKNDIWYFIEFKDCKMTTSKQDNVEKKALNNILMLIDIFKHSNVNPNISFDNNDPIKFIKDKCVFILVISKKDNDHAYNNIKSKNLINEKYTPEYMEKLKEFYFRDAYAYTEIFFEELFLKKFQY